jgi:aminopeptidase-like protein
MTRNYKNDTNFTEFYSVKAGMTLTLSYVHKMQNGKYEVVLINSTNAFKGNEMYEKNLKMGAFLSKQEAIENSDIFKTFLTKNEIIKE